VIFSYLFSYAKQTATLVSVKKNSMLFLRVLDIEVILHRQAIKYKCKSHQDRYADGMYTIAMIKAIVFDCFGVLVGSSFWDVYRASGGDPVKDAAFIDEILDRANLGFITSSELRKLTAEHLGISYEALTATMRRIERPNIDLFAYITSELKPRYKIAMLSNAVPGAPQSHLTAEQLALLDAIVVSGEIGHAKPDREAFQAVVDRLDVTFSEIVFIDDLARYVEPARAMGITSIRYTDLESMEVQLAEILHAQ